ncbi:MAG: VOC family protein [Rhodococcus sp. (in: high G+C Gram-positive bacteria)]|uniref:VOC family protein n=1 Tax=Rhodococcus sp. TaxID=1831 RepID=UPI002AD7186E|nr:VOC family protein [Rhodococcus sp. (in: high G+C Gram-positive bacteria)]
MPFTVDKLYSVGIVVHNIEAAALKYAEIYGIDDWDVREYGQDRLTDTRSYGRPTAPTFRTATGTTNWQSVSEGTFGSATAVTFELVEPLTGESPFQEFAAVRGQGISHLAISVVDEGALADLTKEMAERGITLAASMTVDAAVQRHFFDTREALGGFLIEVRVPITSDVPAGEVMHWNLHGRYSRPEGVAPISVVGVAHFGVVVDDLMKTLPRYHELLGISNWNVNRLQAKPGSLEDPFYRELRPVDHEYFTGMTPVSDFGFELIQPTRGPSHYNREFRDLTGPGIHHMLLSLTTDENEWNDTRSWLTSIDVPTVMGAEFFHGAASFCYYDTVADLGGYIVEGLLVRDIDRFVGTPPSYVVDYTELEAGKALS